MTGVNVVVLGDIGGHADVLDRILTDLGISTGNVIPPGLRVIQVGDLVRADAKYRSGNTRIVSRVQALMDTNPESWTQLCGNHECAALSGPVRPEWDTTGAFDDDCRRILQAWWDGHQMLLAALVAARSGNILVTHAGLTKQRWETMGRPTAKAAGESINLDCGRPISSFCEPGFLVSGVINLHADSMWAEVNHEMLGPWLESLSLPFSQVFGHSSPFHWSTDDWWPDTPEIVKTMTTVCPATRRSITQPPNTSHYLMSVDWNLEDQEPVTLWPLLEIAESRDD